jgi:hypothetical protein
MKAFLTKNKKPIIIFTVALLVIVAAYYFTLGPGAKPKDGTEGSTDESAPDASPASPSGTASGFPIRWGVENTYTGALQRRLNQSLACAFKPALSVDGVLGPATLAAIKGSFPSIGATLESTRVVTQTQYNTIINSKPSCA